MLVYYNGLLVELCRCIKIMYWFVKIKFIVFNVSYQSDMQMGCKVRSHMHDIRNWKVEVTVQLASALKLSAPIIVTWNKARWQCVSYVC